MNNKSIKLMTHEEWNGALAMVLFKFDKTNLNESIEKINDLVAEYVIGLDDDVSSDELPDDNEQIKGTWAVHRNQLRGEQRKIVLGDEK
jgi:hypothetical protein